MKASLYLLIFFLCREAFSQVGTSQMVMGPQTGYLGVPGETGRNGGAVNYNHYDLNGNSYSGGNRSLAEIDDVLPVSEKYGYENFIEGILVYKSGNQSRVMKMNYHQLYGDVQFIDEKGDTLFVANSDSIAFVRLGKALYLHTSTNEYLEIISGNNQIKLCLHQKLKLNEGHPASSGVFNVPIE